MNKKCGWIGRDETGRPYCQHGKAHKAGTRWRCRENRRASDSRYQRSAKGREAKRRYNADPIYQSAKALYELTRVRVS